MKWFGIVALAACAVLMNVRVASAAPADLAGNWHFVLDTPGGDRESDADFKVDGEKVTGKYGKTDVAGTFKDGKMDLAFAMDTEEAGSGTLKLVGTLDGDAISGNWEFTEYNGTFKASRVAGGAPNSTPAPTPKPAPSN